MQRKSIWWALPALAALLVVPAIASQTGYWYGVGDDDKSGKAVGYTLFNMDDGAFLGVTMEEEVDHEEGGARITSVVDGSPAAEAGLEEGDIVVRFDKDTIRGPVSLTKKIRGREAGDTVEITVLRDGRRRSFEVELGERSAQWNGVFSVAPRVLQQLENIQIPEIDLEKLEGLGKLKELEGMNFNFDFGELQEQLGRTLSFTCEDDDCDYGNFFAYSNKPRLGVQLTETTPELREHLGGSEDAGVLVGKVIENSAAEDAGIEVGDLIVNVGGDVVAGTNDLRKALAERDGETFDIEVIRDGRSMHLSVTLEEEDEDRPSGPRAGVYGNSRFVAPAIVAPRILGRSPALIVPRTSPLSRPRIAPRMRLNRAPVLAPGVVEIESDGVREIAEVPPAAPLPAEPCLAAVPVAVAAVVAPPLMLAPVAVPVPVPVADPAAPVLAAPRAVPAPAAAARPPRPSDDVV